MLVFKIRVGVSVGNDVVLVWLVRVLEVVISVGVGNAGVVIVVVVPLSVRSNRSLVTQAFV